MPDPKLTVPEYLDFAHSVEEITKGPEWNPDDPRNANTVAKLERMAREGAFGDRRQRRRWAQRCRKRGGV